MYKAYVYKEIECKEIYLTHIKDSKFCMYCEMKYFGLDKKNYYSPLLFKPIEELYILELVEESTCSINLNEF